MNACRPMSDWQPDRLRDGRRYP